MRLETRRVSSAKRESAMPLHDWDDTSGWHGVHHFWITHLFNWIKPRLPNEYRAYVGSVPALTVTAAPERPDVTVRHWLTEPPAEPPTESVSPSVVPLEEPIIETATLTLDPQTALYVAYRGRLVAALELISPRNKDRPTARSAYLHRYLSYLQDSVHLLLVDVHRRPVNFSFAAALDQELHLTLPPLPAPLAVAYRVGEPAPQGGRFVAIWRRSLSVGQPLPTMVLPLTVQTAVSVNLEETYLRAAADAYLA
jgi:hypothetical protein